MTAVDIVSENIPLYFVDVYHGQCEVSGYQAFDSDNAICTIIYKPDIIKRDLMPYYEFHWNTENGEQSLCIPLMK